jgi:Ca-activated chloride channel family protein
MNVLWPGFLLALGVVPLLLVVDVWMLRRRPRAALRYSSLSLVRAAMPQHSRWRRHLPFALFLLALTSLVVALSRPVHIISVPTDQTTIILAIDVSRSMRSRDIQPSRLEAAEAAALSFIQRQKSMTQIGVVAFAGYGELVQPPTSDQEALQIAVESLTTGRATAIGSGILSSLDAIAEVDKNVAPSGKASDPGSQPQPVAPGAYVPDIIVLLTDGVNNAGPMPVEAAQQAADRGVRVYTIGFGTEQGDNQFDPRGGSGGGNDPFGGNGGQQFGGQQFGGFRRGIDEKTLKEVSTLTGGSYYAASSAGELQKVFEGLPTYLITKHEVMEISVIFTAVGALLAALAIGLALLWHPLP